MIDDESDEYEPEKGAEKRIIEKAEWKADPKLTMTIGCGDTKFNLTDFFATIGVITVSSIIALGVYALFQIL